MIYRARVVGTTCLSLFCALSLWGCADGGGSPDLGEVERFDAYRVYYAGQEVAGLPLEDVTKEDSRSDEQSVGWTFTYGDCDPPSGLFAEGGCQPPLQIQNHSGCRRWPGMFPGKSGTFDLRGTKASWRRGRGYEVFAGGTTIVIFGLRNSFVRSAARQLRDIRQVERSALLPPPLPGMLSGELPCQRDHMINR